MASDLKWGMDIRDGDGIRMFETRDPGESDYPGPQEVSA
jgi:hypothetical protein